LSLIKIGKKGILLSVVLADTTLIRAAVYLKAYSKAPKAISHFKLAETRGERTVSVTAI